jgi:uroporphyrinogen decarboxylase
MNQDLLRVLKGEAVSPPPLWFMRQAGRFLPEYRAIREKASMEQLLSDPDLAAEVTLQPIRRFPKLDGAIIFCDILVILDALGCGVTFPEGGPRLARTLDQIDPDQPVDERIFEPVLAAIRKVKTQLPKHVTMLGFAGAPWTLFAYGMEGKGSRNWTRAKTFLHTQPQKALPWLVRLAEAAARLLNLQIEAGAQAVQLFDTWAGELDFDDYRTLAMPPAAMALQQVQGAPRIYFARAAALPQRLTSMPCEALSIPWQVPIQDAMHRFSHNKALQGNLDPAALLAGKDVACRKARAIVEEMKGHPHIFNLGHGILPETDPAVLAAVIEDVKQAMGNE